MILEKLGIEAYLVKEGVVLSKDSRATDPFMHGIKVLMAKNHYRQPVGKGSQGSSRKGRARHLARWGAGTPARSLT